MHASFKYGYPTSKKHIGESVFVPKYLSKSHTPNSYIDEKQSLFVPNYLSKSHPPNSYIDEKTNITSATLLKSPRASSWEEDYEKLRLETLSFVEMPYSDKVFEYLVRSIEYHIFHSSPCYEWLNLLQMVYLNRYFKSANDSLKFGAKMSYELEKDKSLEIKKIKGIDLPDIIENGWKIDNVYIKISQLLYKEKIYKVFAEPWAAFYKSRSILYEHTVLSLYNQQRKNFESKNIYVSPSVHIDYDGDIDIMTHEIFFEKLKELPLKNTLLYLTTCSFGDHSVACIIEIRKRFEYIADATCYFIDSNTVDLRENIQAMEDVISKRMRGHFRKIKYKFRILFAPVALNFGMRHMFEAEGICGTVAIIFVYFFLQCFLNYSDVQTLDVEHVARQVYSAGVGMINTPVDNSNLWACFIKNCVFKAFLEHYELDGNRPLDQQRGFLSDAWSDVTETGFELQLIYEQDQSRYSLLDETEKSEVNKLFDTLVLDKDSLNFNFFKMMYLILKFQMCQMFFGIILYDENTDVSLSDTISSINVNDNNVKYYVMCMHHVFILLSISSGHNLIRYKNWRTFIKNGMDIFFSSLSGKETLILTRDKIIQQNVLFGTKEYTRFHIFGIKEKIRNTTREHESTDVEIILGTTPTHVQVPIKSHLTVPSNTDFTDETETSTNETIDLFKKLDVSDRFHTSHQKHVFRKTMHSKKQNPTYRQSLSGKFTRR